MTVASEAHGNTRLYLWVWGWLLVLTSIEVYLGYIQLPVAPMLTLLMGLSIIKAALIVAYFMHMRFERFSLFVTLVPIFVLCVILMLFFFFPDSLRLQEMRP